MQVLDTYVIEQLENIRRTAQTGLGVGYLMNIAPERRSVVDLFQHIIDETERVKQHIERNNR